ncbi:MAG: HAMP domain-containing protein [Deltaproteobacteria bacterium]|nr:HAMP domain-containing protein [Deltaproteobacteria bacterium]
MRLRDKLIALCALVAAVPLATVGLLTVRWNQDALEDEIRARQDAVAHHAAQTLAADLGGLVQRVDGAAGTFAWGTLSDEEARGALGLVGRQDDRVKIVALLDEQGKLRFSTRDFLAPAAPGAGPSLRAERPDVEQFVARAPVWRALAEGSGVVVVSPVYPGPKGGRPSFSLAMPRKGPDATGFVVAAEVELGELASRVVRGAERARVTVVDAEGHVVVDTGPLPDQPGTDQRGRAVVRDFRARQPGNARRYAEGGRTTIAAYAPVGTLGWGVIVERDAREAFAPASRMRLLTLAWTLVCTAVAMLLAVLFARRLTGALARLADGARELGKGKLDHRVEVSGRDEVAELGRTLNTMGSELLASRDEILRWNKELEQRVEERTRELKEAQAQLLQAQKLAALGQLGAGVAHEINNPLGGVIGHAQLLLASRTEGDREYKSLKCIEDGARRASTIVQNLLRFSVQHAEAVHSKVDLNRMLRDTLTLTEQALADAKITVEWKLAEPAPQARGDAGQLAQVVLNLVSNARTAMKAAGGTLTFETLGAGAVPEGAVDEARATLVAFRVRDTGKGIAPEHGARIFEPFFTTKDEWSNVGLGLSVSYRIVGDHGGSIAVDSTVGHGSTFTVYLQPA